MNNQNRKLLIGLKRKEYIKKIIKKMKKCEYKY